MSPAFLKALVRWSLKPILRPPFPLWLQRGLSTVGVWLNSRTAKDVRVVTYTLGGVPGEQLSPRGLVDGRAILYFHGGAFVLGSSGTHRGLCSRLALSSSAQVFVPDYRLAPEYPHPAQLQDALTAYRALLAEGFDPKLIAIGGDSAGAGLAMMLWLAIHERKLPPPSAIALISPWVDFTLTSPTLKTHAARDPLLDGRWLVQACGWWGGGQALPTSPVSADLTGAPPMLIHVGSEEILLGDSEALAARAKACGVPVQLKRYEGLWHDFQLHAGVMRESDAALDEMGGFLRDAMSVTARKAA